RFTPSRPDRRAGAKVHWRARHRLEIFGNERLVQPGKTAGRQGQPVVFDAAAACQIPVDMVREIEHRGAIGRGVIVDAPLARARSLLGNGKSDYTSRKMTGTGHRPMSVAAAMPARTAGPRAWREWLPAPWAETCGSSPTTNARDVLSIGTSLRDEAFTAASPY